MNGAPGLSVLEEHIIQLCGLSKMLAPGLLRRALADVQAANPPTPGDVMRALPMIETRMRAYLPPGDVRERSFRMRELLRSMESPAAGQPAPVEAAPPPSALSRRSIPAPSGRR